MIKLNIFQMLFAVILALLIAHSGIAANQVKVGELLQRSKFQIKLHFAMENNCAKVKELLSRRTIGEDINKMQIKLNDELMSNVKIILIA